MINMKNNKRSVSGKFKPKTKLITIVPTTWAHRETVQLNLRDWVVREIGMLRYDISKEVPDHINDPSVLETLASIESTNNNLFNTIRSLTERMEKEAIKFRKLKNI